mgnify:CR=1 FL=1
MRLYLDTSIFGGIFDDEFDDASYRLIEAIKRGEYSVVVSPLIESEIETAPEYIQELLAAVLALPNAIRTELAPEALKLRDAYLAEGILTEKYIDDATHVALASINKCFAIVSWNFKHIVNLDRIRKYNSVNIMYGFNLLEIRNPKEVISNEEI